MAERSKGSAVPAAILERSQTILREIAAQCDNAVAGIDAILNLPEGLRRLVVEREA